jgi:hypothetical protein
LQGGRGVALYALHLDGHGFARAHAVRAPHFSKRTRPNALAQDVLVQNSRSWCIHPRENDEVIAYDWIAFIYFWLR